ncbi:dTDP-4-dehydrorhamnose 3,5-epimerase [Lentisphaerota bacterium WC36G]|nr:dTDP-4-dehydrorhamnose 3,5-epimerase [Lentisphaerae bacterium WC36]
MLKVTKTKLDEVLIVEPKVFGDSRGYFFESYNKERFQEAGIEADFIQDNESFSSYGVLRGLHFQKMPYTQAKLVRVIQGEVLDVAVDIREGSPTYGEHVAVKLSAENKRQLYVPRGFAHGFAVLSEEVIFAYKCDNYYHPEADGGIKFDDESLNIDWLIPAKKMILSEKDKIQPLLKDVSVFNINDELKSS